MKRVTLTRDIIPMRAGQERVVPDDMAARLVAEGLAENPRPFPDVVADRPPPAKTIITKGRRL